jgi:epoxide hydrolase
MSTATQPVEDLPCDGVEPFRLAVPEHQLQDLRERLARTRWPSEVPEADWSRGVPLARLRELAERWRLDYDWRAHEAELNAWPQLTTTIDGARVYALHVRSPEPDALAVVMTHGWPGSVVEFLDVLGPLTDPRVHGGDPADALHLVLPSIPGYPLSGPTPDSGWDVPRIARAWAELMHRLGYDRYGAQGGDWGHAISLELGRLAPDRVVGVHVNTLLTPPPSDPEEIADLDDADRARLQRLAEAYPEMSGYAALQSTRPQTLAYALTDSPVGQLAWIAEKFHDWTDATSRIDPGWLLTNVMLYWLTATAGPAAQLYYESAHGGAAPVEPSPTPVGVAVFGGDIARPVRRLAERRHRIVRWSEYERGGHFAALERPREFTEDARAFFREVR